MAGFELTGSSLAAFEGIYIYHYTTGAAMSTHCTKQPGVYDTEGMSAPQRGKL